MLAIFTLSNVTMRLSRVLIQKSYLFFAFSHYSRGTKRLFSKISSNFSKNSQNFHNFFKNLSKISSNFSKNSQKSTQIFQKFFKNRRKFFKKFSTLLKKIKIRKIAPPFQNPRSDTGLNHILLRLTM